MQRLTVLLDLIKSHPICAGLQLDPVTWKDFDNLVKDIATSVVFAKLSVDKNVHHDKQTCGGD